ncbi:hypothetical protein [Nonomuraea dietziae]|uniref:Uncharacterized protein n=1 Tax=Nonomuraea dietziae TaxID=65515 RepID=A0A7W5VL52_9ACTN|nr:hypothetical protein [Nonomuraea dietziae]MBB3733639.1 hypothetical protein [Nonomuraea dietziae]
MRERDIQRWAWLGCGIGRCARLGRHIDTWVRLRCAVYRRTRRRRGIHPRSMRERDIQR